MPNVGPFELLLLGLLAVIIFGPQKLPEIGRSIGKSMREFKDSVSGVTDVSSKRSGYAVTGVGSAATVASTSMNFSDVTGTWIQPAASCIPGQSSSAAIWVGLGGYTVGSNALEQTGTSADCNSSGKATY